MLTILYCFPLIPISNVVRITVEEPPSGPPPVASDDFVSTDQDEPVTIYVLSNDSDPSSHPLTVTGAINGKGPRNGVGTLNKEDGTFEYTPNPGFFGKDSFMYRISNGNRGKGKAKGMS